MAAVLLAALAGAAFGTLVVAARLGLRRGADPEVGALVTASVAFLVSAIVASPSAATEGIDAAACGGSLSPG